MYLDSQILSPAPAARAVKARAPRVRRLGGAAADELVSIVVPLYNEEENVRPLAEQIAAVMAAHGLAYELLLIDDGSDDRTWAGIVAVAAKNPAVVAVCGPPGRSRRAAVAPH